MKNFLLAASCLFCGFSTAMAETQQDVVTKKWTFIVFMNGDNNLDSYGDLNLNQMKSVGSSDDVNIVVLRDRANQATSSKIYYVQKGSLEVVKDFNKNIDMGDYRNMVDLFKFAQANYPAEHYAFDIWDHGAGWGLTSFIPEFRDISWDDGTGNYITTPQMGIAMAEMAKLNGGKKIDLVGTDACLMQMAEVVNEVAPSVTAMVASEEVEPGSGWDYSVPLNFLTQKPEATALELGDSIAAGYLATAGTRLQQSVISIDELATLKEKISVFANTLSEFNTLSKTQIGKIITQTKGFTYGDFKDLIDFANKVAAAAPNSELNSAALDVVNAAKDAIKSNHSNIANANGLSIWIPTKSIHTTKKARYAKLAWNQETTWSNFLAELYK
jgi:hypothetical protein